MPNACAAANNSVYARVSSVQNGFTSTFEPRPVSMRGAVPYPAPASLCVEHPWPHIVRFSSAILPVALVGGLFSSARVIHAQPSAKQATATRITGPAPEIDGRLNDPAWEGGGALEDFEQQRPVEGGVPSERTRLFFRYDDDALYVGARMFRADPSRVAR